MLPTIVRSILFILICTPVMASQIEPLDLTTLNGQSTLVITGYVTGVRHMHSGRGLYEDTVTVRVTGVLRGKHAGQSLKLRVRQGLVFFDRPLSTGDSGVFFLKTTEDERFDAAYPGSFALFQNGAVKDPRK